MQGEESGRPVAAYGAGALALVSLALAGVFPLDNPDTFGHLAQGRQIVQLGHVPAFDTFSFFRPEPQPWRNYEWLSDLLGYAAFAAGGANALTVLKCALLVLGGGVLLALAHGLGGARALSACAVLLVTAIPASRFRFTERPHLVALPLAALYCVLLSALLDARSEPRRARGLVAALFVLHVAWVNLHGSHLLGLAFTGIFVAVGALDRGVAAAQRRTLLGVLALQLGASCVSPFGPAIAIDAIEHVLNPAYRVLVTEWAPWTAERPFWLIGAPLVQTLALAFVARRLWPSGPSVRALLVASALLAVAAFRSLRFVAEYLLVSAPVIAVGLAGMTQALRARVFDSAVALALFVAMGASAWAAPRLPPAVGLGLGLSLQTLPAASGAWLDRNARAPRVLAAVEDAWFLMFAAPRAKHLADGRIPFYGAEHIARVRRAFDDEAALHALLAEHRVDTVVVRHTDQQHRAFFAHLQRAPGFVRVAIEDGFSLFMRGDAVLRDGTHPRALPELRLYELDWLIGVGPEQRARIRGALAQLPQHENVRGYRGWVEGMLALEPFLRAGAMGGVRPARNANEAQQLERVQAQLERAAHGAKGVPIVHAYLALVAIARCDLARARRQLEEARFEAEARETLLGAQELALREGKVDEVRAFLEQAERMPQAKRDAWLAALRWGLASPARCE